MPRQFRKQKPYIVVFCEGESEQMISELKRLEPGYVKGDKKATEKIAEHYPTAVTNAAKTMKNLLPDYSLHLQLLLLLLL